MNRTDQNTLGGGYPNYLTLDNAVFRCYLFWASILVVKMLLMSLLTVAQRFTTKTFPNPEDLPLGKVTETKFNDPNVERVRRAHRNDLENLLPFLITALAYTAIGPNAMLARVLFRIASLSRIMHTIVYAVQPLPQPTRAISFFLTFGITMYMAFQVAMYTMLYI